MAVEVVSVDVIGAAFLVFGCSEDEVSGLGDECEDMETEGFGERCKFGER